MVNDQVTLRILERADKEILKLNRAEKGAVYEFQHKFRHNPHSPGLQLKQLRGDSRLWSARVTADYRALLLHVGDADYLLVSVKHRSEVYDDLDRYSYHINRVTGGIEVIDLTSVGDSILGRVLPPEPSVENPPATGLFSHLTSAQLVELGIPEILLPLVDRLANQNELLAFVDVAPQLTADVLLALYDGKTFDEVFDLITTPVAADEPVDVTDYAAAVTRPATPVTTDDTALQAILAESFARWQVFLHPTQRKLVERDYNGPARVGGGPGTGKTIVALHRVRHLVDALPAGHTKPVLLTTFNRNLAADLRTRLLALGGPELVDRVDIINIDKLASQVVTETGNSPQPRLIDETRALAHWADMLLEIGETDWDAQFLSDEWNQIILGQAINSRMDYFKARRPGRGRQLRREDRDAIWQLTEQYTKRLEDLGVCTWRQLAERAARVEIDRAGRVGRGNTEDSSGSNVRYRYQHIVVDEAQDLSAAHWKMLRAMAAPGANDMFLVGDSHQRLYDNYVTLSSLGINIRGRSARLTLSYRTTKQILGTALELLSGEAYDDLDGGEESLAGYRSLLRGATPTFRGASTWAEEKSAITQQIRAWQAAADGSVAVSLPTNDMVTEVIQQLGADGINAVEIGPDGPRSHDGIHVGTMHRFKGLEYQRVIIAGISQGLVPRPAIDQLRDQDPRRYQRERLRERSLLFVAATRARDEVAISWHGNPSPFLTGRMVSSGR